MLCLDSQLAALTRFTSDTFWMRRRRKRNRVRGSLKLSSKPNLLLCCTSIGLCCL